jgi:hypothetical protein
MNEYIKILETQLLIGNSGGQNLNPIFDAYFVYLWKASHSPPEKRFPPCHETMVRIRCSLGSGRVQFVTLSDLVV